MTKFEKVIKGLECCIKRDPDDYLRCDECPYPDGSACTNRLKIDALELLKRAGCILEEGLHYFPCGRKLLEDETYCEGDVKDGKTKNDSAREVY